MVLANSTGVMVWSDVERDIIYKKNLNGTGLVSTIVRTNIEAVGKIIFSINGTTGQWYYCIVNFFFYR